MLMADSQHRMHIDQTIAMHQYKLLILYFIFHFCTCNDTLTPAKSIADREVLVSAGQKFALGFFVPGNSSNRYVGIWYYKIPEQKVVWVANRDNPIAKNSSGVLTINSQGNLVIVDKGTNTTVWSTNLSITMSDKHSNLAAKLLDSGNLVLMTSNDSKHFVWQSFDYPSDSMLPGMKIGLRPRLGLNCSLTSWKSKDNPGHGNYSFELQLRGAPQFFVYKGVDKIWRSGPWNGLRLSTMPDTPVPSEIFTEGFVNTTDEISLTDVSTSSTLSRLLLDESGSLQRQIWIDQNRQWNTFWSSSRDRCESYGACGAYAICGSRIPMQCSCLPGFKPKIPFDWNLGDGLKGCVRKRAAQCGNGEGFLMISHVKVPDTSVSRIDMSLSVKECEQKCLSDCSCTAYTAADIRGEGSGCLAWYGDLIDIMGFASGGQDLFVRMDAITLAENTKRDAKGSHSKMRMLTVTLVTLLGGFFLLVTCGYCYFRKRRKRKGHQGGQGVSFSARLNDPPSGEELEATMISPELPFFTLNIVLTATENFSPSNKLGQGGFGPVFKGRLTNGQEIAVKRLSKSSGQGIEEFKNEVKLITKLQHRNLVKILGCCIHKEEKMLIYEYMVNKSLDYFIFDKSRRALLDWNNRVMIIVGIARGVLYLHQDSRLRIIHRDLKASNILLDADMNPKISDFGIARIFGGAHTEENTRRVVGTYGYMSPEYAIDGVFSVKSDVFSFGVLLLEVISGKRSSGYYHEDLSMNLIAYVWNLWREGIALDIVDSCLGESYPPHEVLRCIQVGLLCVQENASERPTMSDVVFMLVNETNLPIPKQPAFTVHKTCNNTYSSGGGATSSSINDVTITTTKAR